jgi:hypothetical protein
MTDRRMEPRMPLKADMEIKWESFLNRIRPGRARPRKLIYLSRIDEF